MHMGLGCESRWRTRHCVRQNFSCTSCVLQQPRLPWWLSFVYCVLYVCFALYYLPVSAPAFYTVLLLFILLTRTETYKFYLLFISNFSLLLPRCIHFLYAYFSRENSIVCHWIFPKFPDFYWFKTLRCSYANSSKNLKKLLLVLLRFLYWIFVEWKFAILSDRTIELRNFSVIFSRKFHLDYFRKYFA